VEKTDGKKQELRETAIYYRQKPATTNSAQLEMPAKIIEVNKQPRKKEWMKSIFKSFKVSKTNRQNNQPTLLYGKRQHAR